MLRGKRLSLIGAGQMGSALVKGFLNARIIDSGDILLSDITRDRLESLKAEFNVDITTDNREAVGRGDILVLAVKPQMAQEVVTSARDAFTEDKLVISIAAGVSTDKLHSWIGKDVAVIRVMPNTPALVGKGMAVISRGAFAGDDEAEIAMRLFSAVGEAIELPESLQNQATAISGSGPAYFFLMVEALVQAGVKAGLDRDAADKLVIQTIAGAAALLQETGKDPGELREMVTSPGGTTAAALQVFSNHRFSFIVQEAVDAAIKRATELA